MKTEQTEFEKIIEIYKNLSLNQMEHLLNLMGKHINIPHYEDGVVKSLDVDSVTMNGATLQINTDVFTEHCNKYDPNLLF